MVVCVVVQSAPYWGHCAGSFTELMERKGREEEEDGEEEAKETAAVVTVLRT